MSIYFSKVSGTYGYLSNFHISKDPLIIDGEHWLCVESYFQAMKFRGDSATDRSVEYSNLIKSVDSPAKAKMLGSQRQDLRFGSRWKMNKRSDDRLVNDVVSEYADVRMREDWDEASLLTMFHALEAKFSIPENRSLISEIPKDADIVELSRKDKKWGRTRSGDGENILGKMLSSIRKKI